MNYYNEFDPDAAAQLRELIAAGLIPPGDVDERSITDVQADDLRGYAQCHFFAGIGGWSLALRLAGWPDERPVWTGSCPCQPFSTAGKQRGTRDERDLWPVFAELIRQRRPDRVFGEQVENAIRHGWLDRVYADMEAENYAVGAAVLGAHSVGAPHRRLRLYWGGVRVDDAESIGRRFRLAENLRASGGKIDASANAGGGARGMADRDVTGLERRNGGECSDQFSAGSGGMESLSPGPGSGSRTAGTGKCGGFRLNPCFSAWLMGFPKEWTEAGLAAFRKRAASRSRRGKKAAPCC
ncbi:MAG: DNA cytosine methyltransferase [Lentisphaeria bacterium]|nr:DNA cytosine methyltransferase [Lentisphaeria bacterium]